MVALPQPSPQPELPSSAGLRDTDGIESKLDVNEPDHAADNFKSKAPSAVSPRHHRLINPKHSIFTLPFQHCNMVSYFTSRGHRCYVLTPRWSSQPQASKDSTVIDTRVDIAAALNHIATHEPHNPAPYIIAHCQGPVALCMALLSGTVKSTQVLSITANSVFMHQVFGFLNSIKAYSPLLTWAYEVLAGSYFPISFAARPSVEASHSAC
ncbi:hypothetical protein BJY04DRAFT_217605 [Aspergillus karnatakaensis]|uniref:uncharacterized protein n=1 Tax=Aspergillus karnatakaensis TaxID=1810916 RepID=UPI003CCCD020